LISKRGIEEMNCGGLIRVTRIFGIDEVIVVGKNFHILSGEIETYHDGDFSAFIYYGF